MNFIESHTKVRWMLEMPLRIVTYVLHLDLIASEYPHMIYFSTDYDTLR